ncbi:MAG: hypothetical protein NVS4B9_19260 [Ktedonobacteraceae bacterium]
MQGLLKSKSVLTLVTVVLIACALAVAMTSPLGQTHAAASASAPPLGTAGNFAVLAATTVTNTGLTKLTGDLGVSPGTACTGFPAPCTGGGPGTVSGTIHAGDAVAAQAQTDALAAYNNAAGQACTTDLTGQDLGGKTLTPGVYCFTSSAFLTGTLTLDAQSNPNGVFIFKIVSTLITASASKVRLINSANACNVFWQVGSSATLGTTTSFVGNILAMTSITATTGATSNGGLYALNGAVTLDTNTVSTCSPKNGTGGSTEIQGLKTNTHFNPNTLSCALGTSQSCSISIINKTGITQSVTSNGVVVYTLQPHQTQIISYTTAGTYVYGVLSYKKAKLVVTVS